MGVEKQLEGDELTAMQSNVPEVRGLALADANQQLTDEGFAVRWSVKAKKCSSSFRSRVRACQRVDGNSLYRHDGGRKGESARCNGYESLAGDEGN